MKFLSIVRNSLALLLLGVMPVLGSASPNPELAPATPALGAIEQCAPGSTADDWEVALSKAEQAFEQRAENADGARPALEPIKASIGCFKEALRLAPERFDIRIGLLHALLFEGEYAAQTKSEKKRSFLEGRDLFEQTVDLLSDVSGLNIRKLSPEQLDRVLDKHEEARPIFFLGALHWGLWADYFGTIAAVREGVAKKIRQLAEATLAVTPDVDEGGAHRLMGRLHFLTPKIPFVTSWVDRKRALSEMEKAMLQGPSDPLNMAFLAEAVAEIGKDRARAKQLLMAAISAEPRAGHWIEDLGAIEEAKKIRRELRL